MLKKRLQSNDDLVESPSRIQRFRDYFFSRTIESTFLNSQIGVSLIRLLNPPKHFRKVLTAPPFDPDSVRFGQFLYVHFNSISIFFSANVPGNRLAFFQSIVSTREPELAHRIRVNKRIKNLFWSSTYD